jgi:hypothetical protein
LKNIQTYPKDRKYSIQNPTGVVGAKKIKRGEKITVEFLPIVYPEKMKPEELNKLIKQRILEAKEI